MQSPDPVVPTAAQLRKRAAFYRDLADRQADARRQVQLREIATILDQAADAIRDALPTQVCESAGNPQ